MIKAIFCDINGVLLEQAERFSIRYSREFNIPLEVLNEYLDGDFDLCLTGKADLKQDLQKLLTLWKWPGTVEALMDYWFGTRVPAQQKMLDYIKKLKNGGLKIFLATQNEKYTTATFVGFLDPLMTYDVVLSTHEVGFKKSNPEYFKSSLEKYQLKPEEVIHIDNNSKAITSAKSLGIHTVFFQNQDQAIAEIENLLI